MKLLSLLSLFSQQILIAVAIQTNCKAQSQKGGAEAEDAGAMYELGERYANGQGVTQDIAQAVIWYRKAAEAKEPRAMNCLGRCYEEGCGLTQDIAQAAEWYRKGAEAGDSDAMFNLANCYAIGAGVEQSESEAFKWYGAAARRGDADAIRIVAEYSRREIGAGKNESKSEELNSRSAPSIYSDTIVRTPILSSTIPENALATNPVTAPKNSPKPNDSPTDTLIKWCAVVCILASLAIIIVAKMNAGSSLDTLWEEIKRRAGLLGGCLFGLVLAALFCFLLYSKFDDSMRLSKTGRSTMGILCEAHTHTHKARGRISTTTHRMIAFDGHYAEISEKRHYTQGMSVNVVYVPDAPSVFRIAKANTTFWQFFNMAGWYWNVIQAVMASFMLLCACICFIDFFKRTPNESEKEIERQKEEAARQEAERARKQAEERKQREREEKNEQERKLQISQQESRKEGEKLHQCFLSFELGQRCAAAKRDTEAVAHFSKAIVCGFQEACVFSLRGTCLHSLGQHQEAIRDFDKVAELDPNDCNNFYMRAMAKLEAGDYRGGERDMRQAIRLSRGNSRLNRAYDKGVEKWGYSSATAYYESELRSMRMRIEGKIRGLFLQAEKEVANATNLSSEERRQKLLALLEEEKTQLAIYRELTRSAAPDLL